MLPLVYTTYMRRETIYWTRIYVVISTTFWYYNRHCTVIRQHITCTRQGCTTDREGTFRHQNNGRKTWLEYYIFRYTVSKGYSSECAHVYSRVLLRFVLQTRLSLENRPRLLVKSDHSPLHGGSSKCEEWQPFRTRAKHTRTDRTSRMDKRRGVFDIIIFKTNDIWLLWLLVLHCWLHIITLLRRSFSIAIIHSSRLLVGQNYDMRQVVAFEKKKKKRKGEVWGMAAIPNTSETHTNQPHTSIYTNLQDDGPLRT